MFYNEYVNYNKMINENNGKLPPLNATKFPTECKICNKTETI